jgi:TonB family protein
MSMRPTWWVHGVRIAWLLGGLAVGPGTNPARAADGSAEPVVIDTGGAVLRDWVQPEYPAEARRGELAGEVVVEFVAELDGTVTRERVVESTNEIFNAPALAAVRQWKLKPALEDGGPVASANLVRVPFHPSQLRQKQKPVMPPGQEFMPFPQKVVPAKPDIGIEPDYPAELEERQLPGAVHLEFAVEEDGRLTGLKVKGATHPAFVQTSLQAIRRASFKPATQGPLPKRTIVEYPVGFGIPGAKPTAILAANHLTLLDPATPALPPQVLVLFAPVYPAEQLLVGESGTATADFTIEADGHPANLAPGEATRPEFAAALRAAIEAWAFKPAQNDAGPIAIRVRVTHEFSAAAAPTEERVAIQLRTAAGIAGPTGLDRKLAPLWRGFPVYPQELQERRMAGEALVELVIDRPGRVGDRPGRTRARAAGGQRDRARVWLGRSHRRQPVGV